jgi:hypothetical protein
MAETVVGVIPDARIKTGMFKSEEWVLVVTDQRLLGARLTDELKKQVVAEAKAEAKASGKGLLRQWGAQIKASFSVGQRYLAMTPEQILAETAGNWALLPAQVKQIKVEKKSRGGAGDDGPDIDFLRITIETAAGKGTYETNDDKPGQKEVKEMLGRVFGSAVR